MNPSIPIRRWLRVAAGCIALSAVGISPASAQDAANANAASDRAALLDSSTTITPAAQAVLDRMTTTFKSIQRYAITAEITRDEMLPFGYKLQNTESARVLGINVPRMVMYTFLINAVLAVVAALLITPTYLAKFDMGDAIGQKAFFAAIIGGFNQTRGALLGGVLIGVLENVVGYYFSPAYKEGVALMLFLVVILFRPEGILGRAEERKV